MSQQPESFELGEGVWLVKVPNYVYKSICNLSSGTDFGKLEVSLKEQPNTNNNININNKIFNNPKENNIPTIVENKITNDSLLNKKRVKVSSIIKCDNKLLKFDLNIDKAASLFAFREKKNKITTILNNARCIATEETVSDFITENTHIEEENKKLITRIETGKGRPQNEGIFKINNDQFYYTNDTNEKAISQINRKDKNFKRTRRDKDELKRDIFGMFTSAKHMTFKQLNDYLDQPDNYLKEILEEVCDYIKTGSKNGTYVLKSEYEGLD